MRSLPDLRYIDTSGRAAELARNRAELDHRKREGDALVAAIREHNERAARGECKSSWDSCRRCNRNAIPR